MRSGFMAGRMIGANFEEDTLTFEMDRGYYAAAGKYVILRDSDYADLNQHRAELLEAAKLIIDGIDLGGNCDEAYDLLRDAIANATQQRKEPRA